jgi:hypothetical protein
MATSLRLALGASLLVASLFIVGGCGESPPAADPGYQPPADPYEGPPVAADIGPVGTKAKKPKK